ncbi:hypothetical protein B0H11DRAFT_415145 [Mycena galericulata]|nr:hypothetical protein B0H11DRAFT_415145 [Mycena galericulata]
MDIPESLLHTICNYSSQWADLELPLPWKVLSQLDLAVEGPLSVLRRLSVGLERYLVEPPPITAFRDAPMLREVHLVLGPVLLRTIVLPWAQLTSFTGHGFFLVECLTVLGRTSSLAECGFVACNGERRPTADILAPLSGIKRLRLEEPDVRRNAVDLLSYLTLPSLQSLELKIMKGLADLKFALQVLLSFLTRSECPLRELCLMLSQTFQKLGELLSRCLRAMPFLEILEIVENTKSPLGVTAILGHLQRRPTCSRGCGRLVYDTVKLLQVSRTRTCSIYSPHALAPKRLTLRQSKNSPSSPTPGLRVPTPRLWTVSGNSLRRA